jgi:hypothetical protein
MIYISKSNKWCISWQHHPSVYWIFVNWHPKNNILIENLSESEETHIFHSHRLLKENSFHPPTQWNPKESNFFSFFRFLFVSLSKKKEIDSHILPSRCLLTRLETISLSTQIKSHSILSISIERSQFEIVDDLLSIICHW